MKNKQKLKAISIIESMVAMVLIVISFGAGMALFLQILTTDKLTSNTKARVILNQIIEESKYSQKYIDETLEREGLTIEKKISPYDKQANAYIISLEALDSKYHQLVQIREIIYIPEE